MKLRAGQRRFFKLAREHRRLALVARRRFGKTHLFSRIALFVNMKLRQDEILYRVADADRSRVQKRVIHREGKRRRRTRRFDVFPAGGIIWIS